MNAAAARAGAVLTIDTGAVVANWRALRDRVRPADCAAVLKADAYGLGAARIGPALAAAGCRWFFVAHLDEGLALKPLLPAGAMVCVLNGLPPGAEPECEVAALTPVLNSLPQVAAWAGLARRLGRRLPAVLQLDSGMARLGLDAGETDRLSANPALLDGVDLALVMSHLACADDPADPASEAQRARFAADRARLPTAPASLANSPGIFLGPAFHLDLARPGAALYGLAPTRPNPMRPVARLQGRVIRTHAAAAGQGVGYGLDWRAPAPTRIATVSVGYADGWLRSLGPRGAAWLGETRLPLAGRVSMDLITLDVGALPEGALGPGDLVDLIGPMQDADAVAEAAGTIGYEVLTALGSRYARVYV